MSALARVQRALWHVMVVTAAVVYVLAAGLLTRWGARLPLGRETLHYLGMVLAGAAALILVLEQRLTRHPFYEVWLGCAAAGVVGALAILGDPVAVVATPLCIGGLVLALAAIDWLLSHDWFFVLLKATLGTFLLVVGALLGYHGLESRRVEGLGAAIAVFWAPGAILAAGGIAFLLSLRPRRAKSAGP